MRKRKDQPGAGSGRNATAPIRCAVYTRKSTEEGLDQDFNTLEAQRESGEAFVRSQGAEGWICLPERYDDGGFSGANTDRPALQRLLAAVKAGAVDVIVVYKIDRLSRSLLDFARLMETLEEHGVSLVCTTQQINTATPMGRLMLHVLLSFAQFEREIVVERTKDKIAASRRKGKWPGGMLLLGYDVDERKKLVVNATEAAQVQAVFRLYLENQALLPVVAELRRLGWTTKRWRTASGAERGGAPFDKTSTHRLLTNPLYAGKVRHKDQVFQGEHAAIIDVETWNRVQEILNRNGRTGGARVRNRFGAFLKGLLRCAPCGCAMSPTHSTRNGKRFRYYICAKAQKNGWSTCPSKSVSAGQIESFVRDRIRAIGKDDALRRETLAQAANEAEETVRNAQLERVGLEQDLARWNAEIGASSIQRDAARLADLHERIREGSRRLRELSAAIDAHRSSTISNSEVREALIRFDPVWDSLTPIEQARLVELLIERVDFDGSQEKVSVTYRPLGIRTLAAHVAQEDTPCLSR